MAGQRKFIKVLASAATLVAICSSCATLKFREPIPVELPFIKNSASECYYLDSFMPVPDSLTSGRSSGVSLRYYSYRFAKYKDWNDKPVVLAFYSRDDHCWSLFEEYYVAGE